LIVFGIYTGFPWLIHIVPHSSVSALKSVTEEYLFGYFVDLNIAGQLSLLYLWHTWVKYWSAWVGLSWCSIAMTGV